MWHNKRVLIISTEYQYQVMSHFISDENMKEEKKCTLSLEEEEYWLGDSWFAI